MTRPGPIDVVMSACGHARPGRPVLARPGIRELNSVWPVSGGPAVAPAVFPGSAPFKLASGRLAPAAPVPRHQRAGTRRPQGPRPAVLAHPLYLDLLEWPGAAPPGCPFDPGRDMLCILTSPPRWRQWP